MRRFQWWKPSVSTTSPQIPVVQRELTWVHESFCAAPKRSTSRVLPRRTMAGRMAASVRRRFPDLRSLPSDVLVDNTMESVEQIVPVVV
jgi:hypothetical protein